MPNSTTNGSVVAPVQLPAVGDELRAAVEAAGIFPRNGPDPAARSWGHNKDGKTFGAQHKLPKQPLPSLDGSCRRYLDALRPLQSEQEHEASVSAVERFLRTEGSLLQRQLEHYDASQLNWFENYCYEAFLNDDSPVVLNSNAFCSFPPDPSPSRNGQALRAAALTRSAVEFAQSIREDRFPLEEMRGVSQCMYQYWWLFGVARVPNADGGRLRMDADARHIMVLCRGQIYSLNVLQQDTNEVIGEAELTSALQQILEDADKLTQVDASQSSVGVLTTENQKTWARCRTTIAQSSVRNGQNLGAIDSSLFALCLDDSVPEGDTAICRNMICGTTEPVKGEQIGTCRNRWYDKLSIIVCKNGAAGMNFEHTCTDGSVDIRLACVVYEGSLSKATEPGISNGQDSPMKSGNPDQIARRLAWDISPEIRDALALADTKLVNRIDQHQLATLNFKNYGKSFITSSGFSPDAFFQMAIHSAYYRMSGQLGNGFEPVLMRQFLHGRTDVVRTATPECAAFARALYDNSMSPATKIDALKTATNAHVNKFKDCAKGNSHHRHLFVLNQIWKRKQAFLKASGLLEAGKAGQDEAPIIFTDPGWSRLGTTVVMGSNVDNPFISYAGFGPPSAEGFTVCYYIRKDYMALSVNSRNGMAQRYADVIEQTFKDLQRLLEEVAKP